MTKPRGPDGRFLPKAAITAAASVIPVKKLDQMPRAITGWQDRAWRLWRDPSLGVLHYPTSFMAEQVGRLAWDVEVNGELLDEEAALASMQAVTGTLGIGEASRRLSLNFEVAGEVFYARMADDWHVFATTTPRLNDVLKGADIVVRGLLADPVDPNAPDSPVRAALDVAEEIRVMSALSRAQSRSRVGQRGILFMPTEGKFPEGDDFNANLQDHLTAPIADEYSASAMSPLKVDYPGDHIEKVRHLLIESPYDETLHEKLDNAIRRLALSLNMPPEVLLGNMDSNHWNAWLSEESTYRAHIEPLALLVGEVFAKAMMEAVDGAVTIVVTPDPAELLARRASFADAMEAVKIGGVGLEYLRRVLGADEDDAPTPADIELILKMQGLGQAAVVTESPSPDDVQPEAPAEPEVEPSNGIAASVSDEDQALDELAHRLSDIDFRLLSVLEGQTMMCVGAARDDTDETRANVAAVIERETERLGKAWSREVTQARKVLSSLGIDAKGLEWDEAQALSVEVLKQGVSEYITANLGKTDSQMPALPTPLLRQVLATAGGSGTATVASLKRNPAPTFADPQGFAIGVLPLKQLGKQDVAIVQWRFRYGPMSRAVPFEPHKAVDGQFMTSDGFTREGWSPGDHKGCECGMDPVFRKVAVPKVRDEVA